MNCVLVNATANLELIISFSFVFLFGRSLRFMDFMMNVCESEFSVHYLRLVLIEIIYGYFH